MAQTLHTKFFKLPVFAQFMFDSSFGGISTTQVLIKLGSASAQVSNGQVLTGISSHQRVRRYPMKYRWSEAPTGLIPGSTFPSLTHLWTLSEFGGTRYDAKGGLNLAEIIPVASSNGAADFKSSPTGILRTTPFNLNAPFTLSFWMYPQAYTVSQLFGKPGSLLDSAVQAIWDAGGLGLFVGLDEDNMIVSPAPALNTWHNIVLTVDASGPPSQQAIYFNSSNVDGGPADPVLTDGAFYVGVGNGGAAVRPVAFPGLISNFMIFNSVLTQGQITTIWNGGVNVRL